MFLISKALRCVCLLSGWRAGQRKEGVALSRRSLVTAWHFKKHEILLIAAGSTQTCTSTRVRTHYWLNGWVCNCTPWDRSCITFMSPAKRIINIPSSLKDQWVLIRAIWNRNKSGFHLLISQLGDRLNSPRKKEKASLKTLGLWIFHEAAKTDSQNLCVSPDTRAGSQLTRNENQSGTLRRHLLNY